MQRRAFVKSGALALVTMGLSPRFLRRTAFGMELPGAAKGRTLICLFQRGAADALNVVVPHGECAYYALRPRIAIPRPSARLGDAQAAIDLDGFFGLHPSLQPLKPLWDRGLLAPIHAVGQSEHHALALRRAGLHGVRHAGREVDAGRLAQPLSRDEGHVRGVRDARQR